MSTHPASELPEPPRAEPSLRTEFVEAYGPQVYLALCAVGTLFLLPFAVNSFLDGRWVVGATSSAVAVCLLSNAVAIFLGRRAPFPPVFIFGPALVALLFAMHSQGLIGILWSYCAILLFHFVLPRHVANLFNASIVVLAVPVAWTQLGPEVTARVAVTLMLTVIFTNVFSFIADAQRRKEAEQRQRLDLIVRGTNAGTLEWNSDGRAAWSRRLRQMLGRPEQGELAAWEFFEFVHPDDRGHVQARLLGYLRAEGPPRRVIHHPPDDYRLLHASGEVLWVHTEAISVTDRRGHMRRFICTFLDISERVRAEVELMRSHEQVQEQARLLERQNQQLLEAIRVREEVERIARHDLKAPLASIAAVPRLLREGRGMSPRDEELLDLVEQAALRVLSMVNLGLDLHRMEEGTYQGRSQAVDLAALARGAAREVRGHADSKRVQLLLELPATRLLAEGEELLCYSILANLVKNAIEAAPEGSAVGITLAADAEGAPVLAIHNHGSVPEPIRASFFRKYATHGKAGGTGLGAYSARLMALVQRGSLEMRTSDDEGTTLTLRLPPWRGALPALAPARAPIAEAGEAPDWQLPPLSLLLVDDDPHNLLVLRRLLPAPPLVLREAINGRAALAAVTEARPDVILLDLQMPVMDGFQALAEIRALQAARGERPSVVVAFSARDDDGARRECRAAGFDHALLKPASREEILAVLRGAAGDRAVAVAVEPQLLPLMPAFIASRRALLAQLGEAVVRGERTVVRELAHTLAGSFGMYGFARAAQLARALSAAAATDSLTVLRSRSETLSRRFEADQAAVGVAPESAIP